MELIETSVFTRQITKLLDEEQYRQFQTELAVNPALGPLIRGGGGVRKVRASVLDHEAKARCPSDLLLGRQQGSHSAVVRISKERGGQSDAETNGAPGEAGEGGIWK